MCFTIFSPVLLIRLVILIMSILVMLIVVIVLFLLNNFQFLIFTDWFILVIV